MWPRSDFLDLLGIEHPILQAPMGGESTTQMAIAVCEAGGLGGLGCSFMSDDAIRQAVDEIRDGTSRPFNLNFFAHPQPRADPESDRRIGALLAPFYEELGITCIPTRAAAPCDPFDDSRLALMLELRPKVVSFHFGLPRPEMVAALRDAGCAILCSATTVAEARRLAAAGVDAIIAQGWEAGGHRGSFDVLPEDAGVGTMALVPQIADAVDVPVIAAGGIADGRQIAAALVLGASGAQLGTAFLACPEANISPQYRAALRMAVAEDTRLTLAFSGRPARARSNRYIEAMAGTPLRGIPDFPTMYAFSDPLERAARESGTGGFEFFLWGQAASMNRELPAAGLMAVLVEEAQAALRFVFD